MKKFDEEILREEFAPKFSNAYNGVKLGEKTKAEYKKKIFESNHKKSYGNVFMKFAPAVAICLMFVVFNVLMININLHRQSNIDETQAGQNNENLPDERRMDVLYETKLMVGIYVNEELGFVSSDKNYKLQVLVEKIAKGVTPEVDAKINSKEQITGTFILRVVDNDGVVCGEEYLSSGATSEYGITLPLDKDKMADLFVTYDNMITFRHLMETGNQEGNYLTTFYGVSVDGEIFKYKLAEEINQYSAINYMSKEDVVTSDSFSKVVDMQGIYKDLVKKGNVSKVVYYGFNEKNGYMTIEASKEVTNEQDMKKIESDIEWKWIYENIDTADEFYAAYPNGEINGCSRDFLSNGLGEVLNELAVNDKEKYDALFDAKTAAMNLLNLDLSDDDIEVVVDYSEDSAGISVRISFEDTGKSAKVYMIKPFGGNGIWIPQTAKVKPDWGTTEDIINIERADINRDGIDDHIVTTMTNSDENYDENSDENAKDLYNGGANASINSARASKAEEIFENCGEICYVRIYDGKKTKELGEKLSDDNCIWWISYATTRVSNGFSALTSKDGRDYMMTGRLMEQQGDCVYEFSVWYLNENGEQEFDGNMVHFIIPECFSQEMLEEHYKNYSVRKDVVPSFKKNIERWFEGATLIGAFDITSEVRGEQGAYVSTSGRKRVPEEYFDNVWLRE